MDASSNVVFKVGYGDVLRRFNARIAEGEIDLGIDGLRKKINNLFGFVYDAELMLTYIDEDGDVVSLVDDDDLRDVVRQKLNPVRISVKVKSEKDLKIDKGSSSGSSGTQMKEPLWNLNDSISDKKQEGLKTLNTFLTSIASGVSPLANNKEEKYSKAPTEATKGKEEVKIVTETEGTSSVKAPESTVPPPSPNRSIKFGPKKEKPKKDKFKNTSGHCGNKKPHMLVRKLAGSYTVLPSGLNPPTEVRPGTGPESGANIGGPNPVNVAPFGLYGYPGSFWSRPPLDLDASTSGPNFECPFSGFPLGGTSSSPQIPSPGIQTQKSYGQHDGGGLSFHRGVRCDGCGSHPIIGPRYKSKVLTDYDLCNFCFTQIGNEKDYIKMDLPAVYPHLTPFRPMSDWLYGRNFNPKSSGSKLDSRFVMDVNVADGTVVAPLTPFTKIWKVKNNGAAVWPEGTQLLWIGGDKLSNQSSVEVEVPVGGLPVDQELDVSVDFTAPELPGRYVSYWRLVSPSGQKFGQRVWVLIQVDASIKGPEPDSFQALNLNLPPVAATNGSTVAETPSVDAEQVPEGGHTNPDNYDKMMELIASMVSSPPQENHQERELPEPSLAPPATTASAPELESLADTNAPNPVDPEPEHVKAVDGEEAPNVVVSSENDAREERLVRRLVQMGFDKAELNREVLRRTGYDLEETVEELCGISEWDPILDELEEMGFHDTERNKVLLKKNGGSIKRVVMDLITGGDGN